MKNWIDDVNSEVQRARSKFPKPDYLVTAFSEESGEFVKAVLDKMFGKATKDDVYSEAIQVIAMAVRLIEEGDPIHKLDPLIAQPQSNQSAFDEWLNNHYFCAYNLKTRHNPRIDLMLNCKQFWFSEDGLLVRVNKRFFPNCIFGDNSISPDNENYFVRSNEVGGILGAFVQSQIEKYDFVDNRELIEHLNETCSLFSQIAFEMDGYNHIRVKRMGSINVI